jgi:hypothetical protein
MGALMTRINAVLIAGALLLGAVPARADWTDMFSLSGSLESDIRFVTDDWRGPRKGDGHEFEMNRNDVTLRLRADPTERVQAVIDTRLRFYGFNESASLPELIGRDKIDPYSFQLNEAYVAVRGLPWSKMDIKVGRMIQTWGTVDMFNPTDNLNARDFSDPLNFTDKVPNQMVEIDLYPTDWLTIQAVWVPTFKPSQLPPSAALGFALEYGENGCVSGFPAVPLDRAGRQALEGAFAMIGSDPCQMNVLTPRVRTVTPGKGIGNSSAALRAKFQTGPVDFSLSYYYGRFKFPVAYTAVADVATKATAGGNFVTDEDEVDPTKTNVKYVAEVMFPRMQVIGADFAYSSDNPWVPGIKAEAALIIPEKVDFAMMAFVDGNRFAFNRAGVSTSILKSANVKSTPFVKASAGLDWSYRDWFYINLMYVRGFFDEFNDRYGLHNFLVAATEFKFLENELQIRLSSVYDFNDQSAMFYPQLTWIVAPSVELVLGYMHFFGETKPDTDDLVADYALKSRFGQKATGRNVAFFKGKVTW